MHDRNAYSCGIGSVVYESTRYWVLVTSADKASTPATATGVKHGVTRSIKTESSRIKFYMWDGYFTYNGSEQAYTGSFVYYGTNTRIGVFIENLYEPSTTGCRIPVSMITYSSDTPNILSVSADGVVTPKSTGTGNITVALKSMPDVKTSFPIEVRSNAIFKSPTITLSATSFVYDGKPVEPGVTVTDCFGNKLVEGTDYTIEFCNNDKAGMGSIRVNMLGNYHNPAVGNNDFYTAGFFIQADPNITSPEPSNPNIGGGTVSAGNTGIKKSMTVKLSKTVYAYSGRKQTPSVAVFVSGKKIDAANYTVIYKNNRNVGVATVTVQGKGTYTGLSAKATFEIRPKRPMVSSLKSGAKKKLSVKWKKVGQTSGYQVQYALNKKFTKGRKTKKVSSSKKTGLTLTKLNSRETYYVRLRAYKEVNGKTYYSGWSEVKSKRIQ